MLVTDYMELMGLLLKCCIGIVASGASAATAATKWFDFLAENFLVASGRDKQKHVTVNFYDLRVVVIAKRIWQPQLLGLYAVTLVHLARQSLITQVSRGGCRARSQASPSMYASVLAKRTGPPPTTLKCAEWY